MISKKVWLDRRFGRSISQRPGHRSQPGHAPGYAHHQRHYHQRLHAGLDPVQPDRVQPELRLDHLRPVPSWTWPAGTPCEVCAAGQYANSSGAVECLECPASRVTDFSNLFSGAAQFGCSPTHRLLTAMSQASTPRPSRRWPICSPTHRLAVLAPRRGGRRR
eukprot:SAG22_NODE_666_length_8013_cov_2.524640_6_plen_162_part_00